MRTWGPRVVVWAEDVTITMVAHRGCSVRVL